MIDTFRGWLAEHSRAEIAWFCVGISAQGLFSARFLLQWIASERVRRSIVPEAFWYFSLAGGAMLLAYAVHRREPVFALGQASGLLIYARNIYLVWSEKRRGGGRGG